MHKQNFKILLVDDSVEWINTHITYIKTFFEEEMFLIEIATSAKDAFNLVVKSGHDPYDIIITDLEMEKIFDETYAGCWLVKNLINRKECQNTKFIIISGSYNICDIANNFNVSYIAKNSLVNNPYLLKYKIMELINIEEA